MKKLKKNIAIILSSILLVGLTGCSEPTKENKSEVKSESTSNYYPVTITTHNYEKEPVEITFEKEPESVVAIYQNSIETMLALGLEDKITLAAGLDHDVKDEYKEAFSKVNYSAQFTPDKETVLMQEPDFILSWYSLFDDKRLGDVDYWHDNDINTYMSLNSGAGKNRTVENEIEDILNLGKVFNVEDKANQIVNDINTKIDEVSESVKDKEKQTTLIVEYMDGQIYAYGKNSLGGDMATRLGAQVLNDEGVNISEEELINLNPDSIFVVYMERGDESIIEAEVDKILKNPALKSLDVVKNNRVEAIALGNMYCSGVRTIDGLELFSKGLYPDLDN